jgi:hypothetical protein
MRIYSSSHVAKFVENPADWFIQFAEKESWVPIKMGRPAVARIAGQSFAKGVAEYHKWCAQNMPVGTFPPNPDLAKSWCLLAGNTAQKELRRYLDAGCILVPDMADFEHSLAGLVMRGLRQYIDRRPLPPNWDILHVEKKIDEGGYCRPDLIYRLSGELAHADVKFKLRLDARYKERSIQEYLTGWQFHHNAWAVGKLMKEPCKIMTLILVVLEPFEVLIRSTRIEDYRMKLWEQSAEAVWLIMNAIDGNSQPLIDYLEARGSIYPWHTFRFYNQFGKTDMADAVLEYALDETTMKQAYVKIDSGYEGITRELKEEIEYA